MPAGAPRSIASLTDLAPGDPVRFRFAGKVVDGVVEAPARRICTALGPGVLSLPVTYHRVTLGIPAADLVDPVIGARQPAARPAPQRPERRPSQGSLL